MKYRFFKGELTILYCPTKHMIVYYFTKTLQGYLFHGFREVIMGCKHINNIVKMIDESIKESVVYTIEPAIPLAILKT